MGRYSQRDIYILYIKLEEDMKLWERWSQVKKTEYNLLKEGFKPQFIRYTIEIRLHSFLSYIFLIGDSMRGYRWCYNIWERGVGKRILI